jgi:hypothetical protein
MTKTLKDFEALLREVHIKGYPELIFKIGQDSDYYWLQVRNEQLVGIEGGRKWRLSIHMTDSEVIQTAFKALFAWFEHEVREAFLFNGKPIFGPHFDVWKLAELCEKSPWDVRQPA